MFTLVELVHDYLTRSLLQAISDLHVVHMNLGSTDIIASINRINISVIYYTPKQMDSKFKGPFDTSNTNWFKIRSSTFCKQCDVS